MQFLARRPAPAYQSLVRAARAASCVLALASLAACGGGGGGGGGGSDDDGGVLQVGFNYTGNALLFRQSTIQPTITGLGGHAPHCTLQTGTIPAGMRLNGDCTITGAPTQAGSFPITVHLSADGVSNTLDFNGAVLVLGPSIIYSMPSNLTAGSDVNVPTLNNFWTAGVGDFVQYSFVGSPPPGLAIDTTTGRITGTPTLAGDYQFKVQVATTNGGNTSTQVQDYPNPVTVIAPTFLYRDTQAWAGIPFTSAPDLPAIGGNYNFTAAALPPGLSIDAATGVISGTATTPANNTTYPIDVTTTGSLGGSFVTTTQPTLVVESPVYIRYVCADGRAGVPYSCLPAITNNYTNNHGGTLALGYAYALDPASSLQAGITVDPATGELAGTTAQTMSTNFTVNVTVTLNGVSFTVPAMGSVSFQ